MIGRSVILRHNKGFVSAAYAHPKGIITVTSNLIWTLTPSPLVGHATNNSRQSYRPGRDTRDVL